MSVCRVEPTGSCWVWPKWRRGSLGCAKGTQLAVHCFNSFCWLRLFFLPQIHMMMLELQSTYSVRSSVFFFVDDTLSFIWACSVRIEFDSDRNKSFHCSCAIFL